MLHDADKTAAEIHLSDKLRPIRLALKVAESLLSRGVSTRDTVSQALDITERYCKERVYFDVSSNVITASQYRGMYKDPLSLMMTVRFGAANNVVVQELQQLVRDIVSKNIPLDVAEQRYAMIEREAHGYPWWLRTVGNALMATGIGMVYTNSWVNIIAMFAIACVVDVAMSAISRRMVPPFFVQMAGAMMIVFLAAILTSLERTGVDILAGINPSVIVVGGILMLVAGLSLAATAQDAIDEFYVTAGARFVKTAMMTIGIVAGILGGLSIVNEFTWIAINTKDAPPPSPYYFQLAGAAVAAAGWATFMQSSRAAIVWAAAVSVGGYAVYSAMVPTGSIVAAGAASFVIGFAAAIVARFSRSPSIAIINSAIIILVPGYMLYRGLMRFVGSPTPEDFVQGMMITTTAVIVALAISAGAAFGTYLGRPVRSHMVRLYKFAPQIIDKATRSSARRNPKK